MLTEVRIKLMHIVAVQGLNFIRLKMLNHVASNANYELTAKLAKKRPH